MKNRLITFILSITFFYLCGAFLTWNIEWYKLAIDKEHHCSGCIRAILLTLIIASGGLSISWIED